ncbi:MULTISPECIES: hypothetical protein [Bacillaceae]|uniref:hypothetical protein n=1 Tax=Bacillaceae TaxID=186817 RepID=UPI002FFE2F06
MFQLIVDHSDINTLNALYLSIYLGIVLKILWVRGVEYSFIGSISNSADTKIIHPQFFHKENSRFANNLIIIRVVKYIRKKACSQDDSEDPISFLFTSYY